MSKQAKTEHEKAVAKIAAINKRIGKKLGNEAVKQGNAAIVANAIVAQLDALSVKREQWESTDYKKANEGLYALLSECLSLYQCKFVSVNNDERKALREGLTNKLTAAGVKVQKNTTTLTMLVRYVFSSDRKRAHGYAAVLIAALSHNVAAADLSVFIADAGGIEEIKRKMVKSEEALARQEKLKQAKNQVATEVELATVAPLAKVAIARLTGDYAVLLAKTGADGVATIVGTLFDVNEALVNALLMRMAKQRVLQDDENAALGKEVDDMLAGKASNDAIAQKAA